MTNYNTSQKDISEGLIDFQIASGNDYFIILQSPTNANITIKLDSTTNSPIPIGEFWQIETRNISNIFISCDAVEGESITYGQADGNLKITTNPQIGKIDTITNIDNFNNGLIDKLDKIINPYEDPAHIFGSHNGQSYTRILNKTLECDKITVSIIAGAYTGTGNASQYGNIDLKIDDIKVLASSGYNGNNGTGTSQITLEGMRGKNISIHSYTGSPVYISSYVIQEYTKKG